MDIKITLNDGTTQSIENVSLVDIHEYEYEKALLVLDNCDLSKQELSNSITVTSGLGL